MDRWAVAEQIRRVSELVTDFPEIAEVDLNPVIATPAGAVAADIRVILAEGVPKERRRYSREEILTSMRRLMQPRSVAVIGASGESGKIGNSVMRNLVDGGFAGEIHPVNPKADDILGRKAYKSVTDVPGEVDVAVFAIPARFVASALEEVGRKRIPNAVLIPSGFAETGEQALQDEIVEIAERLGIRILGPNIYGYYSTWQDLCATFCTPYDVKGGVALTSQSGGIGMAILGFARTTKTGVSAIVGLGNKSDLDEDDLLTWFGEDPHTECIAMHLEDLKDGRAFVEAARATVPKKPVVVLKAGRTAAGARAAGSHTGALAGDDAVYDDILRQAGVIRAPGLNDMLEYARALPVLPAPQGDNVVIITGAGGSGVLLSDAVTDNGLTLMEIPPDLDAAFREFIPPFGAAGNPVDITGGEPPSTYEATIRLGLEDPRIHALVLGYWHTIVTPPWCSPNSPRAWWPSSARRASPSPWWPRSPETWRSRRPASTSSSAASWPTRTRPRSRWPSSAPSTAGRGRPDSWEAAHELNGTGRPAGGCAPAGPGPGRARKARDRGRWPVLSTQGVQTT